MNTRSKIVVFAFSGLALVGLSSMNASARIVCSGAACWHVQETYDYPQSVRVEIHPADWHWKDGERFVWKEHPGRGYWAGDEWRTF